jgi:hypothetical protein
MRAILRMYLGKVIRLKEIDQFFGSLFASFNLLCLPIETLKRPASPEPVRNAF